MRIVVTGGAGFIGSHLCKRLLDEEHEVFCIDNFYTGSNSNIIDLQKRSSFHLHICDISKPFNFCSRIDQIYNLACPASPPHYQRDPVHTIKTNVLGMMNMLELARETGARILQASTSEVYGDPDVHPQHEQYNGNVNPIGPRSCYDSETEVLTNNGWKFFNNLNQNDMIATYENGFLKYYRPDEIIKEKYSGDMYHFNNSKYDLLVTPNHNMVRLTRSNKISFDKACNKIDWKHSKFISGCTNDNNEINNLDYFGIDLNCTINDWIKFFGHYLADGCTYIRDHIKIINDKKYDVTDYKIILTHGKNPNKIKLYKKSFEDIGLNWCNLNDRQIMVSNKNLCLYLAKIGKTLNKFIPEEYLRLSIEQSKLLLKSMVQGDGTQRKSSFTYYTGSEKLKNDIQILILNSGMSSSCKFYPSHGGFSNSKGCYHIYGRDHVNPKCVEPKIIQYNGYVYCVNVKNHIICTRRNGKVVFCGNCYDEGKRVAETMCFDYHRQYDVDVRVVRIFNTYGPNMDPNDGRVVSNFIVKTLQKQPVEIYGEGNQTRSFQYVEDLINGMLVVMQDNVEPGPWNIGNPEEYTMKELAEEIYYLINNNAEYEFIHKDLPTDDPKQRKPDISKMKELGWSPKIKLREGLSKTIKYFKGITDF